MYFCVPLARTPCISSCLVSRLGPMSWPLQSDDLVPVDRLLRACGNDKAYFHVYLMVMMIDRQELFVAVTAYVLLCMLEQIDCGWDVFLSFSNDKYKHRNEIKN